MYSEIITTLLPNTPSLGAFGRPYAPVHFDRKALAELAKARRPFWVRMDIRNASTGGPPLGETSYRLRYPGVKFDLQVWGASTNLDLSMLKLITTEPLTDQETPITALAGAVTVQRKVWRWATPLLVPAHSPFRLQIRYTSQPGGLANNTGWVVLHGVRLERSA